MDIKNLKLKDGRQVIAKAESLNDGCVKLENPMLVQVTLNKENKPQINLFPYIIELGRDGIAILEEGSVEAIGSVSLELENYYIQQTSGIDLTTKLK